MNESPKLIVVRFDETDRWSDDIIEKVRSSGSTAWGYYLVDLSKPFHQASLQLDVQGYFMYNRLWNGEQECPFGEDELTDLESLDGDNRYPTFALRSDWGEVLPVDTSDWDEEWETWDEYIESKLEYYRGNPIEFEFCDNLITLN